MTRPVGCTTADVEDTTDNVIGVIGIAFIFMFVLISMSYGHIGKRNLISKF